MNDFRSAASVETLKERADLLRRTRAFFDAHQFIEVQTPLLSADTVVDRHLDPVPALLPHSPFNLDIGRPMWLQTSPEFSMKRLLASGLEAIYQITPAFRIGESGAQHNPEFTMLEWYRCGDSMQQGIELLSSLVCELLDLPEAKSTTVSDAFESSAGFRPFILSSTELREQCSLANIDPPESIDRDDWDSLFDLLFTELVQPQLGQGTPIVIHDYPATQSALARIRRGKPDVAERFELFVDGIELANGYHELLDPEELLRRNHYANEQRVADGKRALPVESRLLDAMRSGLPNCVGVALGFDRLVMLATGAQSIGEVISFPTERA